MKLRLLLFVQLICGMATAQPGSEINIEDCYSMARQNFPLVRQLDLVDKSTNYTIDNASKAFLPQININAQASYQSDVTEVPIKVPGMNVPKMNKDQYKIYADISQSIYDGGITRLQKQSLLANGNVEKQEVEVELNKLKDRINQLFFAVLIIDEQLKQVDYMKKDIQLGLNKTEAAIANGTALKSSANVLRAELLKTGQRTIEMKATRKGYLEMLGLFINRSLDEHTKLVKPKYLSVSETINRPELKLYEYQEKGLDAKDKMIKAKNLPKFSLFLQGGMGRPALNMLSNKFDPYYVGGLRMNWPISGFYTSKNEHAIININKRSIGLQKETFLLNTRIVMKQQNAEIDKLEKLIASDKDIIELRAGIKNTSFSQLTNGVINTSDYLREVNAEDEARQNRILHDMQLLMAQYNNQTITGN